MGLKEELGFRNPIKFKPHELMLNVYYTAALAKKKADDFFRAHGLTDVQFNVLMLLRTQAGESGGLTQVELSQMMLVNRANITSLIDRMEKARLVRRVPQPNDRRYNIIQITPRGEEMHKKIAAQYQAKIRELTGELDAETQDRLIAELTRLRRGIREA